MQNILTTMRTCLKQWFPQRNLIVVSEHKVRHIPITSKMQYIALAIVAGGVCWMAYSTGNYMATRMALKAQAQTLKTIADARVTNNFNALYSSAGEPQDTLPDTEETPIVAISDPTFAVSTLDGDKLYARMALLEQRVAELQATNKNIVTRVRDRAAGRINDLESIIKQAGLNPLVIKKQASEKKALEPQAKAASNKSEGGPYIPMDVSKLSSDERTLYGNLDELSLLQDVVDSLPLNAPLANYEEESPFGKRIDPFTGHLAFHAGLDLKGTAGARVLSTADGVVSSAGRNGAYGNAVDIDHSYNVSTRYAHLSQILVKEGQRVRKGEAIGIQGSTGRSTGPHVHYEVRYQDRIMNPKGFLKAGRNYVSQE